MSGLLFGNVVGLQKFSASFPRSALQRRSVAVPDLAGWHVDDTGQVHRHGVSGEGGLPETLPVPPPVSVVTLALPLTTLLLKVKTSV
jgi:hypothetical protein